jgi:uncharacterized protein
MEYLWLFIILALVAEIIGTVGGFGSSLFFIPIAGFFFDFHTVLGITAIFHVSSNISKIALFRHGFDKQLILYLGIPSVIFVIIGAVLTQFINTEILQFSFSIFLILISLFFLIFSNFEIPKNNKNAIIGGVFSGFIAGILGSGGAIRGLVLNSYKLSISVFIASSALIDLGIDISRSVVYTSAGYFQKEHIYLVPILLVVSIIGTYIGKLILNHISNDFFRKIVLFLILLTGVFGLFFQ